jgi:hypothetical protein
MTKIWHDQLQNGSLGLARKNCEFFAVQQKILVMEGLPQRKLARLYGL